MGPDPAGAYRQRYDLAAGGLAADDLLGVHLREFPTGAGRLHTRGVRSMTSHPDAGRGLRVVIAEDAVLLREGLVRLLAENDHQVLAVVGDGPSLVDAIVTHRPDVSIVDVRMPPSHTDEGLRAAVQARAKVRGAPVLVLSQYVEVSYADALRRVAAGGTVLDPEVVAQLLVRRRRSDPLHSLTPREREVLALMAEGWSNTAIARRLVVTEGAVEKHVTNIFGKLDLPPDQEQHRRVMAVLAYLRI